jgi:Alkaline and neutral invertase
MGVMGYGLYVNALYHWTLTLFDKSEEAARLRTIMNHLEVIDESYKSSQCDGFVILDRPYYAMWTYKSEGSERFDLLGNCLAILSGIASKSRAQEILAWVDSQCRDLRSEGSLSINLPPCLIPVIMPDDCDWRPRYKLYNEPHHYHNGGIWPFIAGFYVAALVAADLLPKAREALDALTDAVKITRDPRHAFGFNEWLLPQGPTPKGQDWQTWSAAMYLYAEECVRTRNTSYFDR